MAAMAALRPSATTSLLCLRVSRLKLLRTASSRVPRLDSTKAVRLEVATVDMTVVVAVAAMIRGRGRISAVDTAVDVAAMEATASRVEMATVNRAEMDTEEATEEMEADTQEEDTVADAVVDEGIRDDQKRGLS